MFKPAFPIIKKSEALQEQIPMHNDSTDTTINDHCVKRLTETIHQSPWADNNTKDKPPDMSVHRYFQPQT